MVPPGRTQRPGGHESLRISGRIDHHVEAAGRRVGRLECGDVRRNILPTRRPSDHDRDAARACRQRSRDEKPEPSGADDQDPRRIVDRDLIEDAAGGRERFGEHRRFVGHMVGDGDEVPQGECEAVGERPGASEYAEHGTARTVVAALACARIAVGLRSPR
jgi:hypothetical protein